MSKIAITGATGYIGSMLVRHLLREGNSIEVYALVRNMEKAARMLPEEAQLLWLIYQTHLR